MLILQDCGVLLRLASRLQAPQTPQGVIPNPQNTP